MRCVRHCRPALTRGAISQANVHFQQQIGEEGQGGMGGIDGMGGSDGMGMLNDAMGHSDQLIMPS